ncbi:MAG: carboxypeptidase-like regulatory domain-containing protein, partial [Woeseiaceae bacterium]
MRRYLAGIALLLSISIAGCQPQTEEPDGVNIPIDDDDIAGVVRSAAGVEAGVWVIAETSDLGTRFARIVVTDDEGRYVVPDLPAAEYELWVRGYGLADSAKVPASPGDRIDLIATTASDAATAAAVYPA